MAPRILSGHASGEWWRGDPGELERAPSLVDLEVERDGRFVAIHTVLDNSGSSHSSYYLEREAAIEFATNLLNACREETD